MALQSILPLHHVQEYPKRGKKNREGQGRVVASTRAGRMSEPDMPARLQGVRLCKWPAPTARSLAVDLGTCHAGLAHQRLHPPRCLGWGIGIS
jgi:hypothetical protein